MAYVHVIATLSAENDFETFSSKEKAIKNIITIYWIFKIKQTLK